MVVPVFRGSSEEIIERPSALASSADWASTRVDPIHGGIFSAASRSGSR